MTQNLNPIPPEPEPGSALQPLDNAPPPGRPIPGYASEAEVSAFWDGVTHGIARASAPAAEEEAILRWRTDGWTPERQRVFVILLSLTGSVKQACEEAGLSRESAYRLRRKPEGKLFARLWDAARLIARDRLADEAMERAVYGTAEAIVYRGEEVGQRRRYDNRHLQWTLGRLDRDTSHNEEYAAPARRAAHAFDALVGVLGAAPEEADAMLAILDEDARRDRDGSPKDERILLARFEEAREILRIAEADPADIDISDLDPEESDDWTDLQWARAEHSGLLHRLGWDEDEDEDEDEDPPVSGPWSV